MHPKNRKPKRNITMMIRRIAIDRIAC